MPPQRSPSRAQTAQQQLLDAVYSAGLGDQSWDSFLSSLRLNLGHDIRVANLVMRAPGQEALQPLASNADDTAWQAKGVAAYVAEYHRHDPAVHVLANWRVGDWHLVREQLDPRSYRKDRFVNEFLKGSEVEDTAGFKLCDNEHGEVFISFFCALGVQGLSPLQKRRVETLAPHVSRALHMQARLRRLEQRALLAESTLDTLNMAVLLLDEKRTVLSSNAKGLALLQQEPLLLGVHRECLHPFGYSDRDAWAAALADGKLLLRKADGDLHFHLTPVPADSQLARKWQRPLTLMYAVVAQTRDQARTRLIRRFRLTLAEAELALLIGLDGLSLKACAEIRFVSLNTLRTQLKAIYAKTGLHKQTELIRLLQNL